MRTFWRWLIVLILVIGLALALKAGLVAYAGYVCLGVLLLSRYLAKTWISQIDGLRTVESRQLEISDSVDVVLKLSNIGRIPIGWLLVEDILPASAFSQRPSRLSIKGRRICVVSISANGSRTIKYKITFHARGYYQIGPTFAETGDVFGLHRRHRVMTSPAFILVLPKIVAIAQYQFASERPIGEVRLANRLFEDPTRTAGVRPYQLGDPLQRVHWRATARTGQLHSRVFEPTSLAGATILIDFHSDGYDRIREPYRSDLAITTACSLAYAVSLLNQQLGLASNGQDAASRIQEEATRTVTDDEYSSRSDAREQFEELEQSHKLRPVSVETRRGYDQFQQIRELLARLEITDRLTFDRMIIEVASRLPKDATIIAILPVVSIETSVALGLLRKRGFAISVVLIAIEEKEEPVAAGRLLAEGIRDVRFIQTEQQLFTLGEKRLAGPSSYNFEAELA
jgi:uncharacterized protein (DUF58 family)